MFNESARLDAVRRYGVADSAREAALDRIVTLAADLLAAPVALFSVVDVDRIWFKARHGLELEYIEREPGFCASALVQDGPWLVSNAPTHHEARENRLVKEFGLSAYAGVPLAVGDGSRLGALCIMDRHARDFAIRDIGILQNLAALIVDQLEMRASSREAAKSATDAVRDRDAALERANSLVSDGRLLAAIVQSSQDAIVSKDLNGIVTSWNHAAEQIFGYAAGEMIGQSITRIIPRDRLDEESYVLDNISRGQRIDHYETIRRRKDGKMIPISLTVSPIRAEDNTILGASKIARDISERLDSENRIHALLREVNHRVKNQFAVILSMIRQTGHRAKDSAQFEIRIRERIMALARSHDLLVSKNWQGAPIQDLLTAQSEMLDRPDDITATGPLLLLAPMALQYLGMAFHELVHNAVTHGGLATAGGNVHVAWTIMEKKRERWLRLAWHEKGVSWEHASMESGFGRTVLERIAPAALGGHARLRDSDKGVIWELEAPLRMIEPEPLTFD